MTEKEQLVSVMNLSNITLGRSYLFRAPGAGFSRFVTRPSKTLDEIFFAVEWIDRLRLILGFNSGSDPTNDYINWYSQHPA